MKDKILIVSQHNGQVNEKEEAIVSFLHPDYKDTNNVWVQEKKRIHSLFFHILGQSLAYYKDKEQAKD